MNLALVTSNPTKIAEATKIAEKYGVEFVTQSADIAEIQNSDPLEVAKAKARSAYEIIQSPVVVNDASWSIPALHGFPGAYMHDVTNWLTPEDWLGLMAHHADRSAILHDNVVYFDGTATKHFQSNQTGRFVDQPKGVGGVSIEKVITFTSGGTTIAEHHDAGGPGSNSAYLQVWEDFFAWYSKRNGETK